MKDRTTISLIAAIGKNRELGKDNKLLWHIPEDLKRFKELTNGHPMIMGRKTFESIGRVLPNRISIVVTSDTVGFLERAKNEGFNIMRLIAATSLSEAINIAKDREALVVGEPNLSLDNSEIFVIGGGQIFEQAIDIADKLYLTIVDSEFDADTYFPEYKEKFLKESNKEEYSGEKYKYSFVNLER